ncbi:MAG: pyridoxamine 5'-phosphate oxidase family protein [Patescibacteria group bacterium]
MNKKVHDFLKHHPMAVLSTTSDDNKPWGAAIYYVVDDDFNFFFATRAHTLKYENISQNPAAAITIADEASQTTVQAAGELSRVPAEDYMDIVFDKLASIKPKGDHHWVPPTTKIHEGDYMVLKLTPSSLQYADYGTPNPDMRHDYIETIIPKES